MPSGTSVPTRWSAVPSVIAACRALRARYWRYQRHAQNSRKPSAAAATITIQAAGGNLLSSSTSLLPQHRAQCRKCGVDLNILRRAGEQARQGFGYRHLAADQRLDDLAELGGVRGRHEHPAPLAAARGRKAVPGFRRGGRVRAPDLAVVAITRLDPRADLIITHRAGAHRIAQILDLRVERAQTLHVARITDVH